MRSHVLRFLGSARSGCTHAEFSMSRFLEQLIFAQPQLSFTKNDCTCMPGFVMFFWHDFGHDSWLRMACFAGSCSGFDNRCISKTGADRQGPSVLQVLMFFGRVLCKERDACHAFFWMSLSWQAISCVLCQRTLRVAPRYF